MNLKMSTIRLLYHQAFIAFIPSHYQKKRKGARFLDFTTIEREIHHRSGRITAFFSRAASINQNAMLNFTACESFFFFFFPPQLEKPLALPSPGLLGSLLFSLYLRLKAHSRKICEACSCTPSGGSPKVILGGNFSLKSTSKSGSLWRTEKKYIRLILSESKDKL